MLCTLPPCLVFFLSSNTYCLKFIMSYIMMSAYSGATACACDCRLRNAAGLRQLEYWTGKLQPRPVVDWCGCHEHDSAYCYNTLRVTFHTARDAWSLAMPGPLGDCDKCLACTLPLSRYLDKVDAAVTAAKEATDGSPITLLAHSAGGWLARVYLLVRSRCRFAQTQQGCMPTTGILRKRSPLLLIPGPVGTLQGFGTDGIDRLVTLGSPHREPPKVVLFGKPPHDFHDAEVGKCC